MLREWWSRIRFFVTGKKRADVDEELAFHMEREVEANVAAGMPAAEARRRAAIAAVNLSAPRIAVESASVCQYSLLGNQGSACRPHVPLPI